MLNEAEVFHKQFFFLLYAFIPENNTDKLFEFTTYKMKYFNDFRMQIMNTQNSMSHVES